MTSVLADLGNRLDSNDEDEEIVVEKRRPRVVMESDSEDDDESTGPRNRVVMEADDDDEEEDDELETSLTLEEAMKRKSATPGPSRKSRQSGPQRRRRRSSARFLRLSGRFNTEGDQDEEEESPSHDNEQLGEMYRHAIRMNAENRINAGNSWGLKLIENIDKFLVDEDEDRRSPTNHSSTTTTGATRSASNATQERRVNFTKASCTLDASVKIYSYRVDDVHLTSYKVLANLNRTDNNKSEKDNTNNAGTNDAPQDDDDTPTTRNTNKSNTETLETNLANINMNKLDSAFDIDPLFHKMSKTFDEGGAKGLLLVNLGVGSNGCGIVFDSKEENEVEKDQERDQEQQKDSNGDEPRLSEEGMVNISCLTAKLESSLAGSTIESLDLVPQLSSLREEHAVLDKEGYVDNKVPKPKSQRYATPHKEEREAEMSIRQEAMERTRHSLGARTLFTEDEEIDQFAMDDFGGDEDDDDGDDFAFNDFVASDENGARYSSVSFQDENFVSNEGPPGSLINNSAPTNTTVLLDALASGEAAIQGGDYEYFDKSALDKITGGNLWAGAAHWKKTEKMGQTKKKQQTKKQGRKKKSQKKERALVNLTSGPSQSEMEELLKKPTRKTTKRSKAAADPLLFPKATKTKHTNTDNLLPLDAGIGMEELSKLFLRPDSTVQCVDEGKNKHVGKTVGFRDASPFGFEDHDDDSYGDENDGPGFDFADPDDGNDTDDDFVVGELEGVRKVDKIQVGYATVAKKVDVRRLKKDLWNEIETAIVTPKADDNEAHDDDDNASSQEQEKEDSMEQEKKEDDPLEKCLSFQETVKELESSQSQTDVSLPFYFICLLHLANEKGLRLDSSGLEDFTIYNDDNA